jgi:hypothetical protein
MQMRLLVPPIRPTVKTPQRAFPFTSARCREPACVSRQNDQCLSFNDETQVGVSTAKALVLTAKPAAGAYKDLHKQ